MRCVAQDHGNFFPKGKLVGLGRFLVQDDAVIALRTAKVLTCNQSPRDNEAPLTFANLILGYDVMNASSVPHWQ